MANGPHSPLTVRIHDSGRGPYALFALYFFLLPVNYRSPWQMGPARP